MNLQDIDNNVNELAKVISKDYTNLSKAIKELKVTLAEVGLNNVISTYNELLSSSDVKLNQKISELTHAVKLALDSQILELDNKLTQFDDTINIAAAAAAGANGWDASLVQDASGKTQQEINNKTIQSVETVADLLAIKNPAHKQVVNVKRFSSQSQYVGGQLYTFNAASTDASNGFETLTVSGVNGRWKANFANNVINVNNVGYIADGKTDNSSVHHRLSLWLVNNPNYTIVFSNGIFVFNTTGYSDELEFFPVVSHTNYQLLENATIKPVGFNDQFFSFIQPYPKTSVLRNVKISGGGNFDTSASGKMLTRYFGGRSLIRLQVAENFTLSGINVIGGGDLSHLFSCETGSKNLLIENNYFEIPVSDDKLSKNEDFTAIYSLAEGAIVRHNTFDNKTIRGRTMATAFEAHSKNTVYEDNTFINMSVAIYPAAHEQNDISNLIVRNNKGTVYNSFCYFWKDEGQRFANDVIIEGNVITEGDFITQQEFDSIGFTGRPPECNWFGFVDTSGSDGVALTSNNILIQNNTLTANLNNTRYKNTALFHLSSPPPKNITVVNNVFKVKNLIHWGYDSKTTNLQNMVLKNNVIDFSYISNDKPFLDIVVYAIYGCVFDFTSEFINVNNNSDKSIPLISLDLSGLHTSNNVIKEGIFNSSKFALSTIPPRFFLDIYKNIVEYRLTKTLTVPAHSAGATTVIASMAGFGRGTLELLYCSVYDNPNLTGTSYGILPLFLYKADNLSDNYYGIANLINSDATEHSFPTTFYFRTI